MTVLLYILTIPKIGVNMMVLQGSKDSKYGISHMKLGQFLTFVGEMMRAT